MLHTAECSNQRTDYILGLLSSQAKQTFEAHLKQCPECQQEIAFDRRLLAATRETLQTHVPSPAHLQALRPPIPVRKSHSAFLPTLKVLQPVMAAVVIFLIAVGSFSMISTSTPVIASTSTATLTQAPTAVATHQNQAIHPSATPPPPTPIAQLVPEPSDAIPTPPTR